MAQIKSQMKRIVTNEKAHQRNVSIRTHIATASKKVSALVAKKDVEGANAALKEALRLIDKSVSDHVLARSTAARKKASLTKLVNSIAK